MENFIYLFNNKEDIKVGSNQKKITQSFKGVEFIIIYEYTPIEWNCENEKQITIKKVIVDNEDIYAQLMISDLITIRQLIYDFNGVNR